MSHSMKIPLQSKLNLCKLLDTIAASGKALKATIHFPSLLLMGNTSFHKLNLDTLYTSYLVFMCIVCEMNLLTLLSLRTSCIPLRVLSERELMHEIEAPREMPPEGIFPLKPERRVMKRQMG